MLINRRGGEVSLEGYVLLGVFWSGWWGCRLESKFREGLFMVVVNVGM
jgi:hypothetical protein